MKRAASLLLFISVIVMAVAPASAYTCDNFKLWPAMVQRAYVTARINTKLDGDWEMRRCVRKYGDESRDIVLSYCNRGDDLDDALAVVYRRTETLCVAEVMEPGEWEDYILPFSEVQRP